MTRASGFVLVGAAGFIVQMTAMVGLTVVWHLPYAAATVIAVEAAVLHNFIWHERWTWRDRRVDSGGLLTRVLRFQIGTGLTSLGGNLVVTAAAVELLRLPPLLASICAVGATSLANYLVADLWVFRSSSAATVVGLLLLLPAGSSAAELQPRTVAAWNRHVAAVELTLRDHETDEPLAEPEGRTITVPGGTIHEWRGSALIPDITVDRLVHALETPGLPPRADDILDARVLQRDGNALHVYLKVRRSAIVTATYDTEHDVVFARRSAAFATSRSVATSIREVDGSDRGFLWRLNSYWRYRQQGRDVAVDLLSLSLSRDVPAFVRPIAGPLIESISRESMRRTLDAVSRFGSGLRECPGGCVPCGGASRSEAQERGARTSTPEDCKPARSQAASVGAPAVSP